MWALVERKTNEVGGKCDGELQDFCLLCVVQTETRAKATATSATASPELHVNEW
jgi:hypothetical protein